MTDRINAQAEGIRKAELAARAAEQVQRERDAREGEQSAAEAAQAQGEWDLLARQFVEWATRHGIPPSRERRYRSFRDRLLGRQGASLGGSAWNIASRTVSVQFGTAKEGEPLYSTETRWLTVSCDFGFIDTDGFTRPNAEYGIARICVENDLHWDPVETPPMLRWPGTRSAQRS